jgi:hypothetical protein
LRWRIPTWTSTRTDWAVFWRSLIWAVRDEIIRKAVRGEATGEYQTVVVDQDITDGGCLSGV